MNTIFIGLLFDWMNGILKKYFDEIFSETKTDNNQAIINVNFDEKQKSR